MLIHLICDFLEIVFHHILFVKNVYPEISFQKKQMYNIPTWKSRHPGVCRYIQNFINLAKKILESQKKLSLILTITGKDGVKIEEFVFKIHLNANEVESETYKPKWNIEDMLNSLCVSVNTTDPSEKEIMCKDLSKIIGESFELKMLTSSKAVSTDDMKADLSKKEFPWNVLKKTKFELWTRIMPVKTVENEDYMMHIYRKRK
ncbi:mitotic spindle assembly checkpoint protein MAD2B-like [Uloborus diversus]|uniref:mitotic spindle assembly checkpoint protein MAD2B-like n=1 Tax=Uloborus diversus TaxID=327109 RepID=UPI00240A19FB|nr:mitotic spindle assembly checkpoint protein MAD2B-like [Uloborus diversus]